MCAVLLVISFVAPSLSRHPQRGVNAAISVLRRLVAHLHANRSAAKGRQGRAKLSV